MFKTEEEAASWAKCFMEKNCDVCGIPMKRHIIVFHDNEEPVPDQPEAFLPHIYCHESPGEMDCNTGIQAVVMLAAYDKISREWPNLQGHLWPSSTV